MYNEKIRWWVPTVGKKEIKSLKEVIKVNYTNEGIFSKKLEDKVKKIFNIKYAISTTSGTIALFLALKAIGVKKGDDVIVPNITFLATANAVSLTGAKVVLVDVDKDNLSIDLVSLKRKITKKTKVIIPVHISGRANNLKEIIFIAKKNNIKIVEDAAEAMFSKNGSKYLGTFGTCGCFSFSPNKIINSGQGGMIVTNNKTIFKSIKKLKDQGRFQRGTGGDDKHYGLGFNFKYTNLQASVALSQIEVLKKRKLNLIRNYKFYNENLEQNKNFYLIGFNLKNGELPLWVDAYCKHRDQLVALLRSKNIETRNFWLPLNMNDFYKRKMSNFPNTNYFFKKLLWLPSSFTMKKRHLHKVCNIINKFNKSYG